MNKLIDVLSLIENNKEKEIRKSVNWLFDGGDYCSKPIISANLSRILTHLKSGRPFATITAFKDPGDIVFKNNEEKNKFYQKNLDRNKELAIDIRNNGFGYIQLEGNWNEGKEELTKENSFFVIGYKADSKEEVSYDDFKKILIELQLKYEQKSIIVGHHMKNDNYFIELTDKNGNISFVFNKKKILSEKDIAIIKEEFDSGYSELKGHKNRSFIFSGIFTYKPSSLFVGTSMYQTIYRNATGIDLRRKNVEDLYY